MSYSTLCLPLVEELENKRKKYLAKLFIIVLISVLVLALPYTGCISNVQFFIWANIIGACGILGTPLYYYQKYRRELKEVYFPKFIKTFQNLEWSQKGISTDILEKSCLFGIINKVNVDDYFEGTHSKVKFEIAETEIFEIDRAYNSCRQIEKKTYYQVFKGVIILFSINKNVNSITMVTTKKDSNINSRSKALIPQLSFTIGLTAVLICVIFFATDNNTARIIAAICCSAIPVFGMHCYVKKVLNNKAGQFFNLNNDKLKLEDIKFSKRFNVYSKDKAEGRSLVTPAFMERFNNLTTAFGTNKAKCSFFEDKIMFAISTNKNLFELGNLFTSLKNPKNLQEFFDELNSIVKMVEYFKLDENTKIS